MLTNLIGNAVKFTATGSVRVDARGSTLPDGRLALDVLVTDTGVGIAPEDVDRIFEPFTQLTPHGGGGTGLGLTISRLLAVTMGGSLCVESAPRRGSTFTLTVPLLLAEGPEPEAPVVDRDLHGTQILVVEDNPVNRKVARRLLETLGCTIELANDGNDALLKFDADRYDLVLMDYEMPGMNGLDATRALRTRTSSRHVPIVAMTAAATEQDRERCLAAGMDDHITKPVTLDKLRATVAQHALRPRVVRE